MLKLNDQQKFEAIKYRHEDQSKLLQKIADVDLKVFVSFFTLQIAIGGFKIQSNLTIENKIGIAILDFAILFICAVVLWNNYQRRQEVVQTIKNCNVALGYEAKDFYIENKYINSKTVFRPWFWWYLIGMLIGIIGLLIILSCSQTSGNVLTP